jgi:hypothetical protein
VSFLLIALNQNGSSRQDVRHTAAIAVFVPFATNILSPLFVYTKPSIAVSTKANLLSFSMEPFNPYMPGGSPSTVLPCFEL